MEVTLMRGFLVFMMTLCVVVAVSAGDAKIVWSGEVRVRSEVDGRDFRSSTPPNAFTLLRSRLGAEITPAEQIRVTIQLEDSRVFGEEMNGPMFSSVSSSGNFHLRQGYIMIEDLFAEGLSARLGRMELSYGDERLVGPQEWRNVGRSFDAGVIRYEWSGHSIDVFSANIGEVTFPPIPVTPATVAATRDSGQLFSGVYYSFHAPAEFLLDIYAFHEWKRKQSIPAYDDLSRLTTGTYLAGALEDVAYEGEMAYQFGDKSTSDVSAFLAAGVLKYSFSESPVSSVAAGYDYLSGTPLGSSVFRSFDPQFHSGHKFYGIMDYLDNVVLQTNSRGLQDIRINIVADPLACVSVSLEGHNFLLARPWSGSRSLGQEISVAGAVTCSENVTVGFGASGFLPGEVMRAWYNARDVGWWGYVSTRAWF
jgi:hypothetical protein